MGGPISDFEPRIRLRNHGTLAESLRGGPRRESAGGESIQKLLHHQPPMDGTLAESLRGGPRRESAGEDLQILDLLNVRGRSEIPC